MKDMDKRDRVILQAIISSYISTGDPVGSRFLSRKLDFNLSSATIRNIMSDLEELGYLKQPHVSAGRIPTDKAYRFYVDSMVKSEAGDPTLASLENVFRCLGGETANIMRDASRALSDVSHYVGLVMSPRFIDTVFKHIEFLRLGRKRVLTILVSQEGLIQNKLLVTDQDYTQRDLESFARLLNERFAEKPLREVKEAVLAEMAADKKVYDSLLEKAVSLGRKTLSLESPGGDIYVEGTSNILGLPEFLDLDKMRTLFHAFEEKNHLVEILSRCIEAEGVKIFIGAENTFSEMQDFTLVTAPYRKADRVLGVIGVLGPTRMDYGRVIPMVEYTARRLSRILANRF